METKNHAQDDLLLIRQMMERSSKFLSLSGLSGVFAGGTALAGAASIYWGILKPAGLSYTDYLENIALPEVETIRIELFLSILLILIVALAGAVYFSVRKTKRSGQKPGSKATRQLLVNLAIPLVTGGLFSLMLFLQHQDQLIAATTLLFYGMALINAGKFTFSEIHTLGIFELILGLLAALLLNFGLIFWALGFGVLHIAYGLALYRKYEH